MGLCEPDEVWFVDKALYGLRESPKLWGVFRDAELRQARRDVDGVEYCLQQMTSDDQLWRVTQSTLLTDGSASEVLHFILGYMDDIFTVGNAKLMGGFHNWLSSKWECDPVALLAQRQPLRFLGMEIHVGEDGACFEVSQKGFIEELLRAHGHKGSKSWSMGPRDQLLLTPEEEELLEETPPRKISGLVEAVEGALLLKGVEGVMQEIAGLTPRLTICIDNMSAMQLLTGSSGSWRTRHLRLRSSWLKEQVSTGQMRVLHEPEETQLADLGTKPLPRQRLQELVALWRLKDSDRKVATLTAETAQAQLKRNRFSWFRY